MLFGGIVSSKVDRLVKLLDYNEQHQSTKGVILHFAYSAQSYFIFIYLPGSYFAVNYNCLDIRQAGTAKLNIRNLVSLSSHVI